MMILLIVVLLAGCSSAVVSNPADASMPRDSAAIDVADDRSDTNTPTDVPIDVVAADEPIPACPPQSHFVATVEDTCIGAPCSEPVEMFAGGECVFVHLRNDRWAGWGARTADRELQESGVYPGAPPAEAYFGGLPLSIHPTELGAPNLYGCMLRRSGEVYCWGDNEAGQCGDGTTQGFMVRHAPAIGAGASAIALGLQFGCAAMQDGTARCWGLNRSGQLGNGHASASELRATTVVGLSNVTELSRGFPRNHMCARMRDGTAYCWGANAAGQLGNGTNTDSAAPVRVVGLPGCVAQLMVEDDVSFARLADGSLWVWGNNLYGMFGARGPGSNRPIRVDGIGPVADLALGDQFACAALQDGTVRCWGMNTQGQLGLGTMSEYQPITTVAPLSNIVQVVAGMNFACARTRDAHIYCWGPEGGAVGITPIWSGSTTPALVNYRQSFGGGP